MPTTRVGPDARPRDLAQSSSGEQDATIGDAQVDREGAMSGCLAVMYGRPRRVPDNPSRGVHQLDQVLVLRGGCPLHAVALPQRNSIRANPRTNIVQTLDIYPGKTA